MLNDFEFDINGNTISFDGNTNLKRIGTQLPFTKDHIEEYIKCSKNWKYFAEQYYFVLSLDEGLIKPKIRDYQEEIINSVIENRFNLLLASRQIGKSVSISIYILWYILFNKDKNVAILANKAATSVEILRSIKQAYELLPKWLQQGIKVWNTGSIRLENGCNVFAAATSSSSIRGRSINCLFIDEAAFIPRNVWENFYESTFPTISSSKDSKVIMVSTPNGLNHFYQFWKDSEEGRNNYKRVRVDWWQVPGRDEKWKEDMLLSLGTVKFAQEFGNSFQGSSFTLIENEFITKLKYLQPIESNIHKAFNKKVQSCLNIYEEPIKGREYVIGVDSAKMTEDNSGDALGMQIVDVSTLPFKQVATFFAKDGINYLQAPDIICTLGNYYNTAMLFVENNEIGQEVANICHFDLEYDNVYFDKGNLPGYRTTKKTKRLGCSNLKILLESGKLTINDFETISQLSTFIRVKDSYKAESSYQDDLVMSLIGALYFMLAQGIEVSGLASDKILETFNSNNILDPDKLEQNKDEDAPLLGFLPEDEIETEMSIF